MIRFLKYFVLFTLSLILVSCDKDSDDSGSLNIQFKLVYDDGPMQMFNHLQYPQSDEDFFFTRISFYISQVMLRGDNSAENIKDIDFINLTGAYAEGSPTNGFEYKIDGVKPGKYSKLEFGIGVPAAMNAKKPAEYPTGSLLANNTEYWSSWESYVFFKSEGSIYLDGPSGEATDFTLHLGSDESYRTIKLDRDITITGGKTTSVVVTLDMKQYFDSVTLYDIHDTQRIHSLSQMALINQLMDNLLVAFK